MRSDLGAGPLRQCLELANEGVNGGFVLGVGQGQACPILEQVAGTGATDTVRVSAHEVRPAGCGETKQETDPPEAPVTRAKRPLMSLSARGILSRLFREVCGLGKTYIYARNQMI